MDSRTPQLSARVPETGALHGARVAFTGKLSMTRRAAQAAVRAAGGQAVTHVSRRTSLLVVGMEGWPLLPDGSTSSKLQRADALNHQGARIEIVSEAVFRQVAGLEPRPAQPLKTYRAEQVCSLLNIPPETLRRWELLSLVQSSGGHFDYEDIVSLRTIAELVGRGVKPEVISRNLAGLKSVLPHTDRPLCQLKIVMENRETLLAEIGRARMARDGQLTLMFDEPDDPAPSCRRLSDSPDNAAGWLEQGAEHEECERYAQAEQAYRRALELDPTCAEAYFNLANVLRARNRRDGALELYRAALGHDHTLVSAHYNLADVLEEQGDLDGAIRHLRSALEIEPAFADAHYNLANCYQQAALLHQAARHWRAYLKLDPDSEWAEIARRRLADIHS